MVEVFRFRWCVVLVMFVLVIRVFRVIRRLRLVLGMVVF